MMAEVLRACEIARSDRYWCSLGGVSTEALWNIAEADPRNPHSTLGNHGTVLAGGEPNYVRSAARLRLLRQRIRRQAHLLGGCLGNRQRFARAVLQCATAHRQPHPDCLGMAAGETGRRAPVLISPAQPVDLRYAKTVRIQT